MTGLLGWTPEMAQAAISRSSPQMAWQTVQPAPMPQSVPAAPQMGAPPEMTTGIDGGNIQTPVEPQGGLLGALGTDSGWGWGESGNKFEQLAPMLMAYGQQMQTGKADPRMMMAGMEMSQQAKARQDETKRRASMGQALQQGIGGLPPEIQRTAAMIAQNDPEAAMNLVARYQIAQAGRTQINNNVGGNGVDPRPQIGTIPQGYQAVFDEGSNSWNMQAIPGSEPALEQEAAAGAAERRAADASIMRNSTLRVLDDVRGMASDQGFFTPTTGTGGWAQGGIPGTPAYDMRAKIGTLSSRAAFDELQNMRDNSPTGGAVGQLTDKEREALSAAVSNLDAAQTEEQFLKALDEYQRVYLDKAFGDGRWKRLDGQLFLRTPDGWVVPE
ncbi:MAG: hypothetical protein ACU0DT_15530 [Albimonas sp.]|uniref:hypothetical protein n=1 Tax=Albimonas sp. TaxID=1872425 RepID=UPI004056E603